MSLYKYYNIDTMFMNSENSKTSHQHQLLLNFPDKIDLQRDEEIASLKHLLHMEKYKNIKSHKNNIFPISAPKWNDKFEGTDGSYSISNIQDQN